MDAYSEQLLSINPLQMPLLLVRLGVRSLNHTNMKFQFTAIARITLEHTPGATTSQHLSTDVVLECSSNMDASAYSDRGLPKKEGVKPLTMALTQGLIANIHAAHDKGYWDSAHHLRHIIGELERGFARVSEVKTEKFNK